MFERDAFAAQHQTLMPDDPLKAVKEIDKTSPAQKERFARGLLPCPSHAYWNQPRTGRYDFIDLGLERSRRLLISCSWTEVAFSMTCPS